MLTTPAALRQSSSATSEAAAAAAAADDDDDAEVNRLQTGSLMDFDPQQQICTGWPNINRFSKLFHRQNQEKICNNTITKEPTTPQPCM